MDSCFRRNDKLRASVHKILTEVLFAMATPRHPGESFLFPIPCYPHPFKSSSSIHSNPLEDVISDTARIFIPPGAVISIYWRFDPAGRKTAKRKEPLSSDSRNSFLEISCHPLRARNSCTILASSRLNVEL